MVSICKVEGCNTPVIAKGYCKRCYARINYKPRQNPEGRPRQYDNNSKCKTDGCNGVPVANGLCAKCYYKNKRETKAIKKETIKNNGKLHHTKQEQLHIADENSISINSIWKVYVSYTGYISVRCGLFLGYPKHCFFCDNTIHI